jgi:peptide/nickel transport system permease protein
MLGPEADPEAVLTLTQQMGLDVAAPARYGQWIRGIFVGDLGMSYAYGAPVGALLAERMVVTLPLAMMSMVLTCVLALCAGIYAAAHHNRPGDVGVMVLTQLGIATPGFWLAILLILVFSVHLQWFAAGGFPGWQNYWQAFKALVLPAISLSVVQAAILARITRSSMLEVLREDYVRTALAKGMTARTALFHHALRNALVPIITVMGLQFANLLAGAIVIENVFYLPGLGRLIFQSIANRDVMVLRNAIMLLVGVVVLVNFIVDGLYALIDPRICNSGV